MEDLIKSIKNAHNYENLSDYMGEEFVNNIEKLIEVSSQLKADNESIRQKAEEDRAFIECLRAAGVDNWVGYEAACEMLEDIY